MATPPPPAVNNVTALADVPATVTLDQDTPLSPVQVFAASPVFDPAAPIEIVYDPAVDLPVIDRSASMYEISVNAVALNLMKLIKEKAVETAGATYGFANRLLSEACKEDLKALLFMNSNENLNTTHTQGFFRFRSLTTADSQFSPSAEVDAANGWTTFLNVGFRDNASVFTKKQGVENGGPFFGLAPLRAMSHTSIRQLARNLMDADAPESTDGQTPVAQYDLVKSDVTKNWTLELYLKVINSPPRILLRVGTATSDTTPQRYWVISVTTVAEKMQLRRINLALTTSTTAYNVYVSDTQDSTKVAVGTVTDVAANTGSANAGTVRVTSLATTSGLLADHLNGKYVWIDTIPNIKYFKYVFAMKSANQ
jgi:hypothetical protein